MIFNEAIEFRTYLYKEGLLPRLHSLISAHEARLKISLIQQDKTEALFDCEKILFYFDELRNSKKDWNKDEYNKFIKIKEDLM